MSDEAIQQATLLVREGKIENALLVINKALISAPSDPYLLSERGVIYLHLEKKTESLSDMDSAVNLQPKKAYRYASRAYVRDHFGDTHGAIEDYKKALELDPKDDVSYNNLGLLEEKLGWKEEADKHFKMADEMAKAIEKEEQRVEIEEQTTKENPNEPNEQYKPKAKDYFSLIVKLFTDKNERKSFINFLKQSLKK